MKKLLILLTCIIALTSYDYSDNGDVYYNEYKPIVLSRAVLEASIELTEAHPLVKPGRIYIKDNYIYINEKYKGIHVINNTDSLNPINEAFIRIPGCMNMAIKDNMLYADNSVDLVTLDISDYENFTIVSRIKNALPEPTPPGQGFIPWQYEKEYRPENTYIVDYIEVNQ